MGPLYGVGDAVAALGVHPGVCVVGQPRGKRVISFLFPKPDSLMSVGPQR